MTNKNCNPVALITGASSGIGEAIASLLARRGYSLVICARGKERLDAVELALKEVNMRGTKVLKLAVDVANATEMNNAIAATMKEFGQLDLVVANAGYCVYGDFERLENEDFERQLNVNLFGVLNTIRPSIEPLKKSRGRILITGSVSGHIGLPGRSAYAISKFALRGLVESLAVELAPSRVSVTLATPGYVKTATRKVDRYGVYHENFSDPTPAWLQMDPKRVAKKALRAASWRRLEVVITGHALLIVVLQRLLPGFLPRFLMLKQFFKKKRTSLESL